MVKSGTTLGQTDLWSDEPPQRHLVAKSGATLGKLDIWSDVPPGRGIYWSRMVLF